MNRLFLPMILVAVGVPAAARAEPPAESPVEPPPHVVVATLDSGTNLFHPGFRREPRTDSEGNPVHPSVVVPGFPKQAPALQLAFEASFQESIAASVPQLNRLSQERAYPYWVPGTNLLGLRADADDAFPIFDVENATDSGATHGHGAQASSQIAGTNLGLAPDAYLMVVDTELNDATGLSTAEGNYRTTAEALLWTADQPWIDVIHVNWGSPVPLANEQTPGFPGFSEAVEYAVSKGKLVVVAGGNYYAEPSELSPWTGPPGVLVAGANDNCGYAAFSNLRPHVVMDGAGTVSADPNGFGTRSFAGTSSSSPRIAGYAANILLELRRALGITEGMVGDDLIRLPSDVPRPMAGPIADGSLTAAELHEVIRKTASAQSHASQWDGSGSPECVPQSGPPESWYAKVGYGEVSEQTTGTALEVLLGTRSTPDRPIADEEYERSEELREVLWG